MINPREPVAWWIHSLPTHLEDFHALGISYSHHRQLNSIFHDYKLGTVQFFSMTATAYYYGISTQSHFARLRHVPVDPPPVVPSAIRARYGPRSGISSVYMHLDERIENSVLPSGPVLPPPLCQIFINSPAPHYTGPRFPRFPLLFLLPRLRRRRSFFRQLDFLCIRDFSIAPGVSLAPVSILLIYRMKRS